MSGERQREKAERLRALHAGDTFVIPNPWDAGSAKSLTELGFEALATTSHGFAATLGLSDGEVGIDQLAEHTAALDAATELPISVDIENGFGPRPEDAAAAVTRVAAAGAVGGSIEDWDRDGEFLYEPAHALERIVAAVEAARALDFPFTLTARAENHLRGNPDLDDTIARLQAFERAGADVIYAPTLDLEQVRALRAETSAPINVLAAPAMTVAAVADAGGTRISIGGALAWVGVSATTAAARSIREDGDFSALGV